MKLQFEDGLRKKKAEVTFFDGKDQLKSSEHVFEWENLNVEMVALEADDFSLVRQSYKGVKGCQLSINGAVCDFINLCLITKGSASVHLQDTPKNSRSVWTENDCNIMRYSGVDSDLYLHENNCFESFGINISNEYFEQITSSLEEGNPLLEDTKLSQNTFLANNGHVKASSDLRFAIHSFQNHRYMGNVSKIYIDSKIRECFAIFFTDLLSVSRVLSQNARKHFVDIAYAAQEIIEKNYLSPPSLHALASMIGTNECTLKSAFKETFGKTVFGYLFHYRMQLAYRLLIDSDSSIKQVSSAVGYKHQSHFSSAFKRTFGYSPKSICKSSQQS